MNPTTQTRFAALPGQATLRFSRVAPLLAHEWFFGAFLLMQWVRLLWAVGPLDRDAEIYLALILANVALIAWCESDPTPHRWHLRLWFYPVAMNVIFFTMSSAVPKVAPQPWDATLRSVDEFLFRRLLSVRAQAFASRPLTEVLSLCYLLFFPYLVIGWLDYARRGLELFRRLFLGLFTIYGLGFIGYAWVPAAGPYLASPEQFTMPLTGWAITALNARVVADGSNGVDVFPSLHCAVSCYLLGFDRRHSPRRFRILVVPCVGLWLATIYLRYHYFVDVLGGFALAAFGLWLAQRWVATNPQQPEQLLP